MAVTDRWVSVVQSSSVKWWYFRLLKPCRVTSRFQRFGGASCCMRPNPVQVDAEVTGGKGGGSIVSEGCKDCSQSVVLLGHTSCKLLL